MASRVWIGTSGGAWQSASRWSPAIIPTSADDATVAGPSGSGFQTVTGPGNAGSLTLTGNTTLSGTFGIGTLTVGTAATAGALSIGGGSVVTAGSATLLYGPVVVNGSGARLAVTGSLTLGGTTSNSAFVLNRLSVSGGGAVQTGSLSLVASQGGNTISIDGSSSVEVGSTGGVASGTLTIDAGQILAGTGSVTAAGGIVNNGIIRAQGSLTLGTVGGTGQIQIAAGAVLAESGTEPVVFLANTGTLLLSANGSTGVNQGTISGFVQGDVFALTSFTNNLTSATYAAGAAGLGTLTLWSNSTVLASLTLAGTYTGYVFQVSPSSTSPYTSNITLALPVSSGGTPSPGTTAPDLYSWTGSGAWNDASKWRDVTTGANPAAIAPGINNAVTLAGPIDGTYQVVAGPGNSASLTLIGDTTLAGTFNTGALSIGSAGGSGGLNVVAGSVVTAGSATLLYGPVLVNGAGAALVVTGALTLGGASSSFGNVADRLTVSGGGVVRAGGLSLLASVGGDSISVDATSSVEIGNAGGAGTGKLTIDAGQTVIGSGTIGAAAGIVNNGVILAQDSLSLTNTLSGTGQIQIAAGASLTASGMGAVSFLGSTGTLNLGVLFQSTLSEGTITGFTLGDTMTLTDNAGSLTSATYVSNGGGLGTLTLRNGATAIGTLTLAGNYMGATFQVSPTNNPNGFNITLATGPTGPQANFAGTGHSDLLVQNDNGNIVLLSQANLAITAGTLVATPGPTWHTVAVADFNGDGHPDLLLQNTSGAVVDYLMNGITVAAGNYLGNAGPSWHVRGAADFNQDGNADILLQNDNGALVVWTTNGTVNTGGIYLCNPGPGWTVEGVGDFNGDGQPDILLQSTGGAIVDFLMSGTAVTAGLYLGNPGPGWAVAGTGDYNADGHADILLHNDNGVDVVWDTNGTAVIGAALLSNPGAAYTGAIAGLDLNGDGSSDLLIQKTDSTLIGYTVSSSGVTMQGGYLGTPGAGWHAVSNNPVQFIDGTHGNINLLATPGPDQFDLTTFAGGLQQITGFDPAQDSVALNIATFTTYAALQANESLYQGGTFIALTPGTAGAAVVIQGVTPDHLSAANFVLR